jgi:hypothetical protein
MDPITLSLLLSAGPAIFQGIQGIKQTREGKEMQKNLGERPGYQIPDEAKRALALMQNLASSREMPGQASMQNMMDLQAQKAFGNASRAAMSSQDLLGVATNLGEQAQENQLNLGIQSAQNYQQRQQALQGALETMAGYQEKKRADEQQNWYEKAQAAAAMRGAGMQNTLGALEGFTGAAMQGLAMGADAGMFDTKKVIEGDASDLIRKSMMDQGNFALTKRREIPSSAPVRINIPGPVATSSPYSMPFTLEDANQQLMQNDPRAAAIMALMQKQLAAPNYGATPYRNQVGPIDWNNMYPSNENNTMTNFISQMYNPR